MRIILILKSLIMKNFNYKYQRLNAGILILLTVLLHSCGQMIVPSEMVGKWKTDKGRITVRTRDKKTRFKFTSDSAIILLEINADRTVDGSIGSAKFGNGKIKTNWLLPVKMSGIAFTIECGKIGKIFENDPLDSKEVELWLNPGPVNDTIEGELRYTQGVNYFPMAGFVLTREK
jgi:hypothetical protein